MSIKEEYKDLFEAILKIDNLDECANFFEDLCTIQELDKMNERLKAAKLLKSGVTYEKVIEQTKISSATLSRVSKCLKYGNGGYNTIIKRTEEDKSK